MKEWAGRDRGLTALDIEQKAAGGITFDAVSVGWYARNGYPGIYSIMSGGMPAWSGEPVSTETALNHSVVWACNRLISESVGLIPCLMYRQAGNAKDQAARHPMFRALAKGNDDEAAQAMTERQTTHCVLGGNAYSQILRRSGVGTAVELIPLEPTEVTPDREVGGARRLVYVVKAGNAAAKTYTIERNKPHPILHVRGFSWDGLRGFSVVTMARQSIGTATSMERNVARFYANGGRVPYLLELASKFKTDAEYERFRTDWEKLYQEPHRAPILEPGMTYKQTGMSMVDAQLLESRVFTIQEICRWFSVNPTMVGELSRATFSNIEHLFLQFLKLTLNSWLTRWEQDLWRCVLTPDEKDEGYFFHHDVRALLRGDFASRMAGYASALQNGHLSIDEVRDEEDRNPLPDGAGSHYHIQLNMQTVRGGDETLASDAQAAEGTGKSGSSQLVRIK
jgi:HK97 family phage portal protein